MGTMCTGTAYIVMILYSIFSIALGIRNLVITGRPWHILFNALTFIATWEIPLVFSGLAGLFLCFGLREAQREGGRMDVSQFRGLIRHSLSSHSSTHGTESGANLYEEERQPFLLSHPSENPSDGRPSTLEANAGSRGAH